MIIFLLPSIHLSGHWLSNCQHFNDFCNSSRTQFMSNSCQNYFIQRPRVSQFSYVCHGDALNEVSTCCLIFTFNLLYLNSSDPKAISTNYHTIMEQSLIPPLSTIKFVSHKFLPNRLNNKVHHPGSLVLSNICNMYYKSEKLKCLLTWVPISLYYDVAHLLHHEMLRNIVLSMIIKIFVVVSRGQLCNTPWELVCWKSLWQSSHNIDKEKKNLF